MSLTVTTNNVPRFTLDAYELTPRERAELDYLDWPALDAGEDSATFFRYRGRVYDLGEFTRIAPTDSELADWHGIASDSFFTATVVRYADPYGESVVVGSVYVQS
jgi:hypothetical protein